MLASILNFFNRLIDKITINFFTIVIFCVSGIILFFPDLYSEYLNISELSTNWKFFILLCFVTSFTYLFLLIPVSIFRYMKNKRKMSDFLAIKYLKKEMSSDVNKFIVSTFYNEEEKEFYGVSEASLSEGYVDLLKKQHVVMNASRFFDYEGQYSAIALRPKILKYLNSKLRWKRIKIKNGKIVFKIFS